MSPEVVVVGGGAVGMAVAYFLRAEGAHVRVFEADRVGRGASWGNSGWISPSFAGPLNAPGLPSYIARSIGRRDSPLYVAPRIDAALLGWAFRFIRHCNDNDYIRGMHQVARFGEATHRLYAELVSDGLDFGVKKSGVLMVSLCRSSLDDDLRRLELLEPYGYPRPTILDGAALHEFEPFLSLDVAAGFVVEQESFVNPADVPRVFADAFRRMGGEIVENVRVTGIDRDDRRVTGLRTTAGRYDAEELVIAAGAWSAEVTRSLGFRLPLQGGKGYSFSIHPDVQPSRPIHFGDSKIVVTPLPGRTRVSGTMELSGQNLRLDRRRLLSVEKGARRYVARWPDLPLEDEWVGMRPVAADGLPVLGRVPGFRNAYLATGHAMSGITLAPVTGRAMAELVLEGRVPPVLEPFDPGRFLRRSRRRRAGVDPQMGSEDALP